MDDEILFIPVIVDTLTTRNASFSNDTRIASSRWIPTAVDGTLDSRFAMATNFRMEDDYLTVADLYGRQPPGVHHLLKEGGSGFITYENGNRIMIL
jgi:hypothetical protein